MLYNVANWYWLNKVTGEIYSSAQRKIVPANDPTYLGWLCSPTNPAGNSPTDWPKDETGAITYAALDAVLESAGLPATGLAVSATQTLLNYAASKQTYYLTAQYTLNIGTTGSPVEARVTFDVNSQLLWMKAMLWGMANPTATTVYQYQDAAGNNFALTPTEANSLGSLATALDNQIVLTYNQIVAAINAGTITTSAQIDSPPSGINPWPTVG